MKVPNIQTVLELIEAAETVLAENPGAAYPGYHDDTNWTPERPGPMYNDFDKLYETIQKIKGELK